MTWFIFMAVLVPSLIFAVNFGRKIYVEILKVFAGKSARVFRFLTCGTIDLTEFRLQHLEEDSDDDNEDDHELAEAGPNAIDLQGFNA